MGPNIEPCGIPNKSIWKTLSVPFIVSPCFLRFKYQCAKVTASFDKLYAWRFAAGKLWGMQSETLERSIRAVPTKFWLSRDFFQFSISLNKAWFEP